MKAGNHVDAVDVISDIMEKRSLMTVSEASYLF